MKTGIPPNFDACPSTEEWISAIRGRVDSDRWSVIERHLDCCPECEARIDTLTEPSDTFVRHLCQQPSTPDDEPAFRNLYSKLVESSAAFLTDEVETPAPPTSIQLPRKLGNYELLASLGHGANGSVFQARHIPLNRLVAIKLLREDQGFHPEHLQRFAQEIRAAGQLNHPHLVRFTDAGETNGQHFLVMEYVPGIDLSAVVRKQGPLRIADACEVVRQTAVGLVYLHDNGFIHRDVKPSNLLLTSKGEIKLLDLGLVQNSNAESDRARIQNKWAHGTADYMSPEQWTEFDRVDIRADLYSLGCTFFKLLTGLPPYRPLPPGFTTKCDAHRSAPVPILKLLRREIPDAVQRLVDRLLAKSPEDRFTSPQELLRQIRPLTRGADLWEVARLSGIEMQGRRAKHGIVNSGLSRREALLSSIAAVCAVAVGGTALYRKTHPTGTQWMGTDSAWRRLQVESPPVLLSLAPLQEGSWKQATEDELRICSVEPLLLNLGQPLLGTFRITVEIAQAVWKGNAGIFFKHAQRQQEGVQTHTYQTMEIVRDEDQRNATFRLLWSGQKVTTDGEKPTLHPRQLWADVPIESPLPGAVVPLQISLGMSGFPDVFWNGKPLPVDRWKLSFEGKQQTMLPSSRLRDRYLGRLGLIAWGEETIFSGAKLMYVGRNDAGIPRGAHQ